MRYLKLFFLASLSLPTLGQVPEIYTIKVLGKPWQLNGFNVQYQVFVPKMIDSTMISQEVMHLLYDGGHSGSTPDVFQNMQPNEIDTEWTYVPTQFRNGVNVSAVFKRNTSTSLLKHQELKLGLLFNSATVPPVFVIDMARRYHHFFPVTKDLSFDAAYQINTRPIKRWAFYAGIGSTIGFSIQNKYIAMYTYPTSSNLPNRNDPDARYKLTARDNPEIKFHSRPSFVSSSYSLVGAKFNLDCEFNFFFEAAYGYGLRKYSGVQLLTNSYLGFNFGVRYKVFAEKQGVKNSDRPFW